MERVKSTDRGDMDNNASHTEKYQKYIAYNFAYKVACVRDKFDKPIVLYKGKNAVNKFIEAILEKYCKKVMKKTF